MSNIEKNLKKYNISIPESIKPIANYSPFILSKNFVFISGQVPIIDGNIIYKGKVGKDLNIDEARKASRLCMLNSFAALKDAVKGDLFLIKQCVKITVFVNSIDTFVDQPLVADAASDIISNIMEPYTDHSRSAVSVNSLPKNSAIEIDSIFEISLAE